MKDERPKCCPSCNNEKYVYSDSVPNYYVCGCCDYEWRVNPYPRQVTTQDIYGNVTGAYDNPKWAEWEKENKTKN